MAAPKKTARQELIDSLPKEMQLPAERILNKHKVINDEDPIFALTEVLGYNAAFLDIIPKRVIESGETITAQQSAVLKAFDERIATLRGLAILIQKATDRLDTVPQEIADKFPALAVAKRLTERIESHLDALPLGKFATSVQALHKYVNAFVEVSARYTDALQTQGSELKSRLEVLEKEKVGVERSAGGIKNFCYMLFGGIVGAGVTTGILWMLWGGPLETILKSQSFIGVNAVAGADGHGPFLYIAKEKVEAVGRDPSGNVMIRFKPVPPGPVGR